MVGDYRAFALKRAQSLGVFTSPPSVFDSDCSAAPTTSSSPFLATAGAGTVASLVTEASGAWRLTMFAGPDRREMHWKGEYVEVEPPERLVLTMSDQPGEDRYELITVVLTDLGDGRTEMLFQQRGRMSASQYGRAEKGWSSFFDRMAEQLAEA